MQAQKARQRAVAAAQGIDHLAANHLAVLHLVELELLGVAEVLKDFSVVIGHCNAHVSVLLMFHGRFAEAAGPAAARRRAVADAIVAALDHQRPAVDQAVRDLPARALTDLRHRGAGDLHLCGALLVGAALRVHQANHLEFVQAEHHRPALRAALGCEAAHLRLKADSPASLGSGHLRRLLISVICRL